MSENNFVASTSSNQEEPRNKISRKKCFEGAFFYVVSPVGLIHKDKNELQSSKRKN